MRQRGVAEQPILDALFQDVIATGEKLRLTRSQKTSIQNLANEWTRLAAELRQVQKTIGDLTDSLRPSKRSSTAWPRRDQRNRWSWHSGRRSIRVTWKAAWKPARQARTSGSPGGAGPGPASATGSGTLEDLQAAAVPTAETVDRFEVEFAQVRQGAGTAPHRDRRNAAAEQAEAEAGLEHLRQTTGAVLTEDDLTRVRGMRDRFWIIIRRAWESGRLPSTQEVSEWVDLGAATTLSPQPLADGFEQSITQADSHADRLRREVGTSRQAGHRAGNSA